MEFPHGSGIRRALFRRAPSLPSLVATLLARDARPPMFAYLRPDSALYTRSAHASPSPANTSFSSTLKLPPSKVSGLVFFNHSPRRGRPDPAVPLQSETFSASISVCAMGTSADWFFFSVTRSFNLYSNRSPSSCPLAAASPLPRASSRLTGEGGGGGDGAIANMPPPLPDPQLLSTCGRFATALSFFVPVSIAVSVFTVAVSALTSTLSALDPKRNWVLNWFSSPGETLRPTITFFWKPCRSTSTR